MKLPLILFMLGGLSGAISQAQPLDGKTLFIRNCSACHQSNGAGIPGAYPALAGNQFVLGEVREPASVLLKGRGGMPNFSSKLDDRSLAEVLNYVRTSWGNQAAPVTESDIQALRQSIGAASVDNGPQSTRH